MTFCITTFIAIACASILILFTEITPKWFKLIFDALGSFTLAYAVLILARKLGKMAHLFWFKLWPNVYILAVVLFAISLVYYFMRQKKLNSSK